MCKNALCMHIHAQISDIPDDDDEEEEEEEEEGEEGNG